MDIKQADRIAKEHGGTLLGYHTIPLPVYQVFVNYETFDDNPFFPIKQALLQWIHDREDTDDGKYVYIEFVASLLGMDKNLVQQVYDELKRERYIITDPETGLYRVTQDAVQKFILPDSRPRKKVSGSIILDGKNFNFLPAKAYKPIIDDEVYVWNKMRNQDIDAHKPIDMSTDSHSAEISLIEKALDQHERRLEDIGLEHNEGKDFKVTQIEKKYIYPVFLVYVGKEDGGIAKLPYIGDVFLNTPDTPAISHTDNFTFFIRRGKEGVSVSANLGYNANDETKKQYINVGSDDRNLTELVRNMYMTGDDVKNVVCKEGNYWYINITEDTLKHSVKPGKIIADCSYINPATQENDPQCVIKLNGNGVNGVLIIQIKHSISLYLKLDRIIRENHETCLLEECLRDVASDWRQRLLDMGRYSVLEEVDSDKYIHPFT